MGSILDKYFKIELHKPSSSDGDFTDLKEKIHLVFDLVKEFLPPQTRRSINGNIKKMDSCVDNSGRHYPGYAMEMLEKCADCKWFDEYIFVPKIYESKYQLNMALKKIEELEKERPLQKLTPNREI